MTDPPAEWVSVHRSRSQRRRAAGGGPWKIPRRSRAVMLLMVLLTLTLAAVVIAPLATFSGVEMLTAAYQADALRHRLAAESVVALLPELLRIDGRLNHELDRCNRTGLEFLVGDVHVKVLLQDDSAKLSLPLLFETRSGSGVRQVLASLEAAAALPPLELAHTSSGASAPSSAALRWTGCLDDLFVRPTDAALFGSPDATSAWSQSVGPLGSVVNLRRADAAVLEALLADLQAGVGGRLAQLRDSRPDAGVDELLSALELPAKTAQEARRRLTRATQRYSLLICTKLAGDVRQRYVVCDVAEPAQVLVDWEVAP